MVVVPVAGVLVLLVVLVVVEGLRGHGVQTVGRRAADGWGRAGQRKLRIERGGVRWETVPGVVG